MAAANDPETQHRNWERVIPGDITLRLQDTFIPDFYRDLTVGGQVFVKPLDPANSQLATAITQSDVTLTLQDGTGFASSGVVWIENEQIVYTGRSGSVLSGLVRGANNTPPAAHATNASVTMAGPTELDLLQNVLVRFVELCGPNLDYLLERAKDLPQLVQIDNAPWEFLRYLGGMLGYHWVDTKDVEQQRKDIELFLDQCKIKGTRRGIERAVLKSGATRARVTNLNDRIFTIAGVPQLARFKKLGLHWENDALVPGVLGSQLSGSDLLTDPENVRWGVYEIATDLSLAQYIDALVCYAHPAGTRFVTARDAHRRVVASTGDESLDIDFEVQTQQDVIIDVVERLAVADDADPEVLVITAVLIEQPGVEVTGTADSEPTLPSILFEDTKQVIL